MSNGNPSEREAMLQGLHVALQRWLLAIEGLANSRGASQGSAHASEEEMRILLSLIADPLGQDWTTLAQIWAARASGTCQADFLDQVKTATRNGEHNLDFILEQFSTSVNPLPVLPVHPSDAEQVICSYLEEIRPALEQYLARDTPLNLWMAGTTGEHTEFLNSLKMPISRTRSGGPDMVLHNLGTFERDKKFLALLEKLFPYGSDMTETNSVLLNTSGSGKTRTMLEGLCLHWGIYLTCLVDSEGRGSADLQTTIGERIARNPDFEHDLYRVQDLKSAAASNSEIAQNRFTEVLLARLCIMNFFCKLAGQSPSGLTAEHRKLWVYLQVRPSCLSAQARYSDIFESLTDKIKGVGGNECLLMIREILLELTQTLDKNILFCVIDEAQAAATSLKEAFFTSQEGGDRLRPALRELVLSFTFKRLSLTITGTALDKADIDQILASRSFKDLNPKTMTHCGTFSSPSEQIAYMQQFLPPHLAETRSYQILFKRVTYWLKGRYRFTAAYMRELLLNDFQLPHLTLNKYISTNTSFKIQGSLSTSRGFQPTDFEKEWEDGTVVLKTDLATFNFEKLKNNPTLENLIREHAAEYCMRSEINPIVADEAHFGLVTCGFGRYTANIEGDNDVKIALDEPLVLLALGEWLQVDGLPLAESLRMSAAKAVHEAHGANGLEEYLALYLSTVFDDKTPLTQIFKFHEDIDPPEWATRPATLVSLYADTQEGGKLYDGRVSHGCRPSATIGKSASRMGETRAWLEHNDRAPICFPDVWMGPDILCILRVQDQSNSLIWVALQSKFDTGNNILAADTLRKAIPTVTPHEFYGLRKPAATSNNGLEPSREAKSEHKKNVLQLLDALPDRLPPAVMSDTAEQAARANIIEQHEKAHATRKLRKLTGNTELQPENTLTADAKRILQAAGKHSMLRVVIGWPARTQLHERGVTKGLKHYFDEENHPIVELDVTHWGQTMRRLHKSTSNFVEEVQKLGQKRKYAFLYEDLDEETRKRTKLKGGVAAAADELSVGEVLGAASALVPGMALKLGTALECDTNTVYSSTIPPPSARTAPSTVESIA